MKKLFITILLILLFSINLLSQIDFSGYPKITPDDLSNYKYKIIYNYEELNVKIVIIEGITYVVYY